MNNLEKDNLTITKNESVVLEMLKSGMNEKDIAEELGISLHTIKSHKIKFEHLKLF